MRLVIRTPEQTYYAKILTNRRVLWTRDVTEAWRFLNLKSAEYCMNALPEDIEAEVIDLDPPEDTAEAETEAEVEV